MALVRVREHVNPLSRKYQDPVEMPDWKTVYKDAAQPLHLDVGCARGKFVLEMAQREPSWNFLGLEIREPLVHQALSAKRNSAGTAHRDELELKNLHYLFCNINTSIRPLLASLEAGTLSRVSIQFPDPWFKRKHQKRRVVQPEIVDELSKYLIPGGTVFVQSDVLDVAQEMVDRFSEHPAFVRQAADWLLKNPFEVPTEREVGVLSLSNPVYRALFLRKFSS
ncbi:tRNA (guanosine(46)-N7)-methyltransferase TrmB [Myxacorys almedinensis]|uniref:tRNA (guanine-N(7)-)-methyltransferase n=1 Tax=Myxacorys almedinensis A TaxID=2690445 RepID=A0A8J7Z0Y0_9CYAN|nr:tRNA (guanosine(46)-N7)-methyltransferase TrmB [Myxacorys almedinensis]NDJ17110.1 tRNA (guanosine(46)-N7)-methyltransferase TrmB [Myxacorys almedinensis A]